MVSPGRAMTRLTNPVARPYCFSVILSVVELRKSMISPRWREFLVKTLVMAEGVAEKGYMGMEVTSSLDLSRSVLPIPLGKVGYIEPVPDKGMSTEGARSGVYFSWETRTAMTISITKKIARRSDLFLGILLIMIRCVGSEV